jgi:heptosyltransferase-2
MPSTASASTDPKRILIRAPNWIGDCVMSMPAVQRLRERFPQAHIALLAKEKVLDLWKENPHLNELIPLGDIGSVAERKFEMAILFPNSFRVAWEAWRAEVPKRVGYAGHWRRWLLTDLIEGDSWNKPTDVHFVHHFLAFSKHLGGSDELVSPKITLQPAELHEVDPLLAGASAQPLCALAPSAEYGPAKRWLPERFIAVAKQIAQKHNVTWVIVGGPNDVELCRPIAEGIGSNVLNLTGKTTLRQLCAVLARCRVLLTNDSGAMHVGYAVGTRVVAIFGSTEPAATGPIGEGHGVVRHKVDCSPCFLRECPIDFRCMKRIEVDEVTGRVSECLSRAS